MLRKNYLQTWDLKNNNQSSCLIPERNVNNKDMNIIADLHTHTLVSHHAFNTLTEMAKRAQEKALFMMAVTDHGPDVPDGAHPWYFYMINNLPDVMEGIFVVKGVEANINSLSGGLDTDKLSDARLSEYIIASIHSTFFGSLDYDEATELWLNIAKRGDVDVAGHPEEARFAFDYDRVTKAFADNNVVVELNANSPKVRTGNEKNVRELLLACKKNSTSIVVNSDAHSIYTVGDFDSVMHYLDEMNFPEELVVNSSKDRLLEMFKTHNYELYKRILDYDTAYI